MLSTGPFRLHTLTLLAAIAGASTVLGASQEQVDGQPRDYGAELPRIAPLEPAEALSAFQIRPGLAVEIAAAEPEVRDPVALDIDARGRMYVVEMRGYSEWRAKKLGCVRLLEDRDGDGRFETSSVFAADLAWPTAIVCWDGGVFVAQAPDILYLKDIDGDGRADVRETVFSGFGLSNVQGLLNSLRWGLDGRIHGATSLNGGEVRSAQDPTAPPLSLRGRDFAFDPLTRKLQATSGGGQHGMNFDAFGAKFVCSNSNHAQFVMFDDRYAARNPFVVAPLARVAIAPDGAQADVYRTSPEEPWRVVRTRLRVQGIVSGPIERGGQSAGYFTGATGITIYGGDALPPMFQGSMFVGDVGGNLVHRKTVKPNGIFFVAERAEPRAEFLSSTDPWFRPVQFADGPDGALYVIDMYREVIEHPKSLPPQIKRHLDLASGRERGRIWRVVPAGFERPQAEPLDVLSSAQLVALLGHANAWQRNTAARLLHERQAGDILPALVDCARECKRAEGRVLALHVLDDWQLLDAETLLAALGAEHPRVREQALVLSEAYVQQSAPLRARVCAMVSDPDERVRYQLAFSLGAVQKAERLPALAELALDAVHDRWIRFAILTSLPLEAGEFAALLAQEESGVLELIDLTKKHELLLDLAQQAGASGLSNEVAGVLAALDAAIAMELEWSPKILQRLLEGLAMSAIAGDGLAVQALLEGNQDVAQQLEELFATARTRALDDTAPTAARVAAIRTLSCASFEIAHEVCTALLRPDCPHQLQHAAVHTLGRFARAEPAQLLLAAWPAMSPDVRAQTLEVLCSRDAWIVSLLDAVASGAVLASQLESTRIHSLMQHPLAAVRVRAQELLQRDRPARAAIIEAYSPALQTAGDPRVGKTAFARLCMQCHRLGGIGHAVGPDLAAGAQRSAETLLLNIIDPNREIHPQYVEYAVLTDDERVHTGIICAESASSITLKRAGGVSESLLRVQVNQIRSSQLSLMPEGLEQTLDTQGMADLLAYLLSARD